MDENDQVVGIHTKKSNMVNRKPYDYRFKSPLVYANYAEDNERKQYIVADVKLTDEAEIEFADDPTHQFQILRSGLTTLLNMQTDCEDIDNGMFAQS